MYSTPVEVDPPYLSNALTLARSFLLFLQFIRTCVLFLTDWVRTDNGPVRNSSSSSFVSSSWVSSLLGFAALEKANRTRRANFVQKLTCSSVEAGHLSRSKSDVKTDHQHSRNFRTRSKVRERKAIVIFVRTHQIKNWHWSANREIAVWLDYVHNAITAFYVDEGTKSPKLSQEESQLYRNQPLERSIWFFYFFFYPESYAYSKILVFCCSRDQTDYLCKVVLGSNILSVADKR